MTDNRRAIDLHRHDDHRKDDTMDSTLLHTMTRTARRFGAPDPRRPRVRRIGARGRAGALR